MQQQVECEAEDAEVDMTKGSPLFGLFGSQAEVA